MRPGTRRPSNLTPTPKSSAAGSSASSGSLDLGLESEIFWDRHKNKVFALIALALVALIAYSIFLFARSRAIEAANVQFSAAKSIDELKKMIADHPGSVVAADASLVLAHQQAEAKDFDGAASTAQSVVDKFPAYPMIGAARLAVGANLAAAGKLDQADAAYKLAAESNPKDFAAPLALLARANLARVRGNSADARRFYDDVIARYPKSDAAMQAEQEKQFVRAGSDTPANVPATSPAPAASTSPAASPAPAASTAPAALPAPATSPAPAPK